MGIARDSRHKRRLTGGRRNPHQKKRKYEIGRVAANTKLAQHGAGKRIHQVRTRGGNIKHRALRLDTGTFSWGSEGISRKTRLLDVVYNASNNELVRTKTLVKNAIVQIDATSYRQWYEQHYGVILGKKRKNDTTQDVNTKKSKKATKKIEQRKATRSIDTHVKDQFNSGRLLACISSRPGQSGRCDGYILEGKELEFYQKKIKK